MSGAYWTLLEDAFDSTQSGQSSSVGSSEGALNFKMPMLRIVLMVVAVIKKARRGVIQTWIWTTAVLRGTFGGFRSMAAALQFITAMH